MISPKILVNMASRYLGKKEPDNVNIGKIGKLIDGCFSEFFAISFPHSNSIKNEEKVKRYAEVKDFLSYP